MSRRRLFYPIMAILVCFSVALLNVRPVGAVDGDILDIRIVGNTCEAGPSCNGFVAEIDIEGLSTGGVYDFGFSSSTPADQIDSIAKVRFNVTSPGYDTSGNPTLTSRKVYGTQALRRTYPNNAQPNETAGVGYVTVRIVLSEFIYSGDIVTLDLQSGFYTESSKTNDATNGQSVSNNSTYAYPKPVGRWAWAPYERVTSDFLIESVIFHRFARDGKPLAAVKYTCVDEHSNVVNQIVNDMTVSTREDSAGTGNKVLVYAATIPITGFTQGDVITCNFIAYPWVGDASATLNSDLVANGGDGFAQPEDRLGPFELLNDKSGTYGTPCAVVSSTGQASTALTWVYPSCAAAEAAYAGDNSLAYTNIGYASQAVRNYNNANHGHNDPGGATIKLLAQNYAIPGNNSGSTLGTQKTWLIVEPASSVPCQTPVFNTNGSTSTLNSQKVKYSCISTLQTTGSTFRGNSSSLNNVIWLDRMKLNHSEGGWARYWIAAYATRNTVDQLPSMGFSQFSSNLTLWALLRGNVYTPLLSSPGESVRAEFQNVIGNKNLAMFSRFDNPDGRHISDNAIYAFNTIFNDTGGNISISMSSNTHTTFSHGVAIVQNIVETVGTTPAQPNIGIQNMGGTDNINNLIAWHNTSRGQRSNVAYAADSDHCSSPQPLFTNWTWKYNLDSNNNRVGDLRTDHGCPADGARTGNWAMTFMVGGAGNALAVGGGPSWSPPEYYGLSSVGNPATEGFVDDQSGTTYGGAGGGFGDYRLTSASSLRSVVGSGQAVLPFDIEGTSRYNNGLGAVGAYEFELASSKSITSFSIAGLPSATINETTHTITLNVPYGTSVNSLVPSIGHSGTSVSPASGLAQNFSSPVVYTVTAEDLSAQAYTVTINVVSPPPDDEEPESEMPSSGGGTTNPGNTTNSQNGTDQSGESTEEVPDEDTTTAPIGGSNGSRNPIDTTNVPGDDQQEVSGSSGVLSKFIFAGFLILLLGFLWWIIGGRRRSDGRV